MVCISSLLQFEGVERDEFSLASDCESASPCTGAEEESSNYLEEIILIFKGFQSTAKHEDTELM